ncbi:MAG: hypothetical protein ACKD6N_07445 [Candidatus Bathyarchaeota archaeon]
MTEAELKSERLKVYRENDVQILLSKFISRDITELRPTFDPVYGYRYLVVENLARKNPEEVKELVNKLRKLNILKGKLYDKFLICPSCGSRYVSTSYLCPHCQSINIERQVLIEHLKCGNFNLESYFGRAGDKLVCPKCGLKLEKINVDYRIVGVWFVCGDCGRRFATTNPTHRCYSCGALFNVDGAKFENIYIFTLDERVAEEIKGGMLILSSIGGFLEKLGFKIESPGFLRGESGVSHKFDVVARKDNISVPLVLDIVVSESSVTEFPLLGLYAKVLDVSKALPFLVVVPAISEEGRKLASTYKINLIEAKDPQEIVEKLNAKVSKEFKKLS